MDYQKFHRTKAVIEVLGGAIAAVWGIVNIFRADSYAVAPVLPVMIAQIINHIRALVLTGWEDYEQESYAESQHNSYKDNRKLIILTAVFTCAAFVLVIVKTIIR